MIIVKLMGGLGNQMFQYAFAKQLAHTNHTNLTIDTSYFDTQTLRTYELNVFQIKENIISGNELNKYLQSTAQTFTQRIQNKFNAIRYKVQRVPEKQFHFDPSLLKLKGDLYLEGYWQSEKYFKGVETVIRDSFQLKPEFVKNLQYLAEQIRSKNSISVHIRRGDYVLNAATNKEHGTVSLDYYERAIEYMAAQIDNPFLYIFSDDMDWVRANLKIMQPHAWMDNENKKGHEDLFLMSQCKHQIIANSSFSWWAAWLNAAKNKLVIAPQRWFNESEKNTTDIIPENWIKL